MLIADLLRLVRSGQIELASRYDVESGNILVRLVYRAPVLPEDDQRIQAAIFEHQGLLVYFLRLHDTAVCSDPGAHAPYHVEAEAPNDRYQKCTECERLRAELSVTY